MDKQKKSNLSAALVGVIAGVLIACAVISLCHRDSRLKQYPEWRKLDLVLMSLSENYVDSIAYKDVPEKAIGNILSGLDPHSVYLRPEDLQASEEDLAGNFEGIGIRFTVPNDTAIVNEVIHEGPAERAGLQVDDRLLKVDTLPIAGVRYPQDSMVRRMKGPSGSKVTVTVLRGKEQIPYEITRGRIPVHCVIASFMLNDSTGYIKLDKFSRTTVKEFVTSSLDLLSQGMKTLVFDLRGNTGGYFDQALALSNFFLPKGADIVYMEGRHRKRESYQADGKGFLKDVGLKVLIDEGSASSSEIFAGAIQDNDRGMIIGQRSFGKGLVQEPMYFSDGSGLRLTVARFYTPSGRCIQKPYGASEEEYLSDFYNRYMGGELLDVDSIKVNKDDAYLTAGGRTVYGGGGIIPDIFVPIDTTVQYVEKARKLLTRYPRMSDNDFYKEYTTFDNVVLEALKEQ